jgi:hypothetical protein
MKNEQSVCMADIFDGRDGMGWDGSRYECVHVTKKKTQKHTENSQTTDKRIL